MPADPRVGKTLPIRATHAGHVATVIRRDIEKPKAYRLRCECGEEFLMGEYWLDRALARGWLSHIDQAVGGALGT